MLREAGISFFLEVKDHFSKNGSAETEILFFRSFEPFLFFRNLQFLFLREKILVPKQNDYVENEPDETGQRAKNENNTDYRKFHDFRHCLHGML